MNILFIIAIVALVALYIWYVYNELVASRVRIKEAWSQIDVQLKRRADLIPNLVETVKGYVKHERRVFENVTKARSVLLHAKTPAHKSEANNQLVDALKTLFAVAENYPNLRASENFKQLQEELSDTEDKVSYANQFYNTVVSDYNTKLETFPSSLIAQKFGFSEAEFFKASESERKPVKVAFE